MPNRDGFDEAIVRLVHDAYVEVADPAVTDRHLQAMVAVARVADLSPIAPSRSKMTRIRKLVPSTAAIALAIALGSSGLAYAGVPFAPNPVKAVVDVASGPPEDTPPADNTPAHVQERTDARNDFLLEVDAWAACVSEKAQAHEGPDEFDPHSDENCGPRPKPEDHPGMTGPPDDPSGHGRQTSEDAKEKSDEAREANAPDDAPDADDGDGPPDDAPAGGPPHDVPPTGPPTGPPSE